MTKIRISRPTQILIAANLLLVTVVSAQVLIPPQPATTDAPATSAAPAELPDFAASTLDAPSISQLVELMERPLFYPDRRMPKPEVAQAPPPPPTPLRLKLEGVAIAGGARVAVLRNLNGQGLIQLKEGEAHDGWTLDALSSGSATFSRGAQTNELLLDPGTGR